MANIWDSAKVLNLAYSGDSDPANGGVFYSVNSDDYRNGYIDAIRLQPCSDAGAQDNAFWLEYLTLSIPESPKDINETLRCCGMVLRNGAIINEYDGVVIAESGTVGFMQVIAECCVAYISSNGF